MDKIALPISTHDLNRIKNVIARVDMMEHRGARAYEKDEIVISDKRVKEKFTDLKIYGVTIRLNEDIELNEGLFIRQDRESISFDFEGDLWLK